jgi:hypothetical protein
LIEISLIYPQKYFKKRKEKSPETLINTGFSRLFSLVAGVGLEPTTFGL